MFGKSNNSLFFLEQIALKEKYVLLNIKFTSRKTVLLHTYFFNTIIDKTSSTKKLLIQKFSKHWK